MKACGEDGEEIAERLVGERREGNEAVMNTRTSRALGLTPSQGPRSTENIIICIFETISSQCKRWAKA